ncbi:VTT domain-containing protein [Micromonospora sp. NPDC052213]|uniref:TVP38/TMEM64 family protein n=1 Tax=Micromonospora sp. NPDC052213 TaxID=3155812 RepID=UPI003444A0DD
MPPCIRLPRRVYTNRLKPDTRHDFTRALTPNHEPRPPRHQPPASLIMVANGALFGVLPGALLSMVGGLGATLAAFGIGRRGRGVLTRITTPAQRTRAEALLERYGLVAVCLTRPVPVLAETVAMLAGTSDLGWGRVTLAAGTGVLPASLLFAAAGAAGQRAEHHLLFIALLGLAALGAWMLRHRGTARYRPDPAQGEDPCGDHPYNS